MPQLAQRHSGLGDPLPPRRQLFGNLPTPESARISSCHDRQTATRSVTLINHDCNGFGSTWDKVSNAGGASFRSESVSSSTSMGVCSSAGSSGSSVFLSWRASDMVDGHGVRVVARKGGGEGGREWPNGKPYCYSIILQGSFPYLHPRAGG